MPSSRWCLAVPAAALVCLVATGAAASGTLDSLVAAERAFARRSVEQGMREAFLAFLADDGVIFRPRATPGRRTWQSRGPVAATLVWEPVFAEVSAAGDLGYTTGPWELRPEDPRDVSYGNYVSVWQKQADGTWRVAVDIGITHAQPMRGLGHVDFVPGPGRTAGRPPATLPDLAALDREWSRDARTSGSVAAFARRAAPDVRFYRDHVTPVLGARGAREMVGAVAGVTIWNPEAQRIARSGDLGCTYGMLERRSGRAAPDSSVYLHIWRKGADGRWKVALALENPLPRSEKK
jgi:ketosteroid isomerase-like protein